MTAGFKFERAVGFNSLGDDGKSVGGARHHHVFLSGGFGTLTFGQQDAPYYGATTWDGSQTLGGLTDFIFRASGITYASTWAARSASRSWPALLPRQGGLG